MNHPYKVGDRLDSALFGPRFYLVIEVRVGCIVTQTPQGFRFECLPGSAVYESNRGRYPVEWGTPVAPIEDEEPEAGPDLPPPPAAVAPAYGATPAANGKPKKKRRR